MRYRAAEKLEIIRLVEQSSLPVRRTVDRGFRHEVPPWVNEGIRAARHTIR